MTLAQEKAKRKKNVLEYANSLSSVLVLKKRRTILEADVWKNYRELEYVKYKIDQKSKAIDETGISIEKIDPELSELKEKFSSVESVKNVLEEEYCGLLDIHQNLDKKRSDIENNRAMILELKSGIKNSEERIQTLENTFDDMINKKEQIKQTLESNREKFESLQAEIEINKNTKQLMTGLKPESLAAEAFLLLGAHDENVESYQSEATDMIDKMQNEISSMQSGMKHNMSREREVQTNIKTLENRIARLKTQKTTGRDGDSLKEEIDALLEKQESHTAEIKRCKHEKSSLTSELSGIKKRHDSEKNLEKQFLDRFEYLTGRKKEMDGFGDIQQEMENIEHRIAGIIRGITGDGNFIKVVNNVKQEMASFINYSLQIIEDYRHEMNRYEHLMLLKHRF